MSLSPGQTSALQCRCSKKVWASNAWVDLPQPRLCRILIEESEPVGLCVVSVPNESVPTAHFVSAEGVVVAKKEYNLPNHPEIEEASNLEVIKLMTSLTSRDLVTERFSWKHYYWFLTEAGLECALAPTFPPPYTSSISQLSTPHTFTSYTIARSQLPGAHAPCPFSSQVPS